MLSRRRVIDMFKTKKLSSRRLSKSGWDTLRGRAQRSADRGLQLAAVTCALGAVLIDWTQVRQLAADVEAKWSLDEGAPSIVVPPALADMERDLADVELPIELHESIEQWKVRFATSDKMAFEETLSRAGLYSEMIRGKLRARGMPTELFYLAMIESGFRNHARSLVSATGMWQFMGPTAVAYGLRIDAYVDERRDPVKATDAALDYLSDLYQRYGSWYPAAAAYNARPRAVSRALARHSNGWEGDEDLYWEIIDHLPAETAQYVPKLLAATYLARDAALFDLDVTLADPYVYDLVWGPGRTALSDSEGTLGLLPDRMHELNPQLIRGVTPPGGVYPLRVPVGRAFEVMAALAAPSQRDRLADD